MAVYSDIEQSKKERHKQSLFLKLTYMFIALTVAFVVLVMAGYEANEVVFRKPSEDSYYFLKFLEPVINKVFYWYVALRETVRYVLAAFGSEAGFSWSVVISLWDTLASETYFKATAPMSITVKGGMYRDGSHVFYLTLIFFVSFFVLWDIFKGKYRPWKKYLYYPFSALFFGSISDTDREKFLFKGGWNAQFLENFFKRYVRPHDGYQRAKYLKYWELYPSVLAGESINGREQYLREFLFVRHLFLNEEEMDDLFHIVEGYMTEYKTSARGNWELFKEDLGFKSAPQALGDNKPYFFDRFVSLSKEQSLSYRCFNGRDEVTFSTDAIMYILDAETESFKKMLNEKGRQGRNYLSKTIREYIENYRLNPTRNAKMLFGVNNRKKEAMQFFDEAELCASFVERGNEVHHSEILDRLVFVLTAYFRFILLRDIILQYMNLPSGTVVVKLDDYTLRMILDSYAEKNLIQVDNGKNDGTNQQFENDTLANVFIFAYWFYSELYRETTLQNRLNYHFNTNVLEIISHITEEQIENEIKMISLNKEAFLNQINQETNQGSTV